MNFLGFGSNTLPSVINEPFKKEKITWVSVYCIKGESTETWSFSGKVKFKNGNTIGEQEIQGKSFDDVVIQIKSMIDNL